MKYRLFGRTGLRVSELCLGTMTFGMEWQWGSDRAGSQKVFETYAQAGGNFLDTANLYTEGTSEKFLGDFLQGAGRDHFVVATKYTLRDGMGDPNFSGNHRKNLYRSVKESLKRLQTDYIDLLWLHMWDFTTQPYEIMRSLDDLIKSGTVHYIGISDAPAWIVAQCNTLSKLRGWEQFAGLQIEYSLLQRAPERELLPMARSFGQTITPWAPLAGGALTGKYLKGKDAGRVKAESARRSEKANKIAKVVVAEAQKLKVSPAQVALAWVCAQGYDVIPIVGARTPEQLKDNLGVLDLTLPAETLQALNEVSAIELGFPHDFLVSDGVKQNAFSGVYDKIDFGGRR